MLRNKRVVFIGAGNMGGALIQGLTRAKKIPAKNITALDTDPRKLSAVRRKYGVCTTLDHEVVREADIVVLAVKPRDMDSVITGIAPFLGRNVLVISVAAGILTAQIEKKAGRRIPVIRSMPNMPVLVGAGAIAICRGRYAGKKDEDTAAELLGCSGTIFRVPERQMNTVTAVSGSGPAYVFYLAEAMTRAGKALGLDADVSASLVVRTILGSARLLEDSDEGPAELRQRVTSPGGTTEAAVRLLDTKTVKAYIGEAIKKARYRADEISRTVS